MRAILILYCFPVIENIIDHCFISFLCGAKCVLYTKIMYYNYLYFRVKEIANDRVIPHRVTHIELPHFRVTPIELPHFRVTPSILKIRSPYKI